MREAKSRNRATMQVDELVKNWTDARQRTERLVRQIVPDTAWFDFCAPIDTVDETTHRAANRDPMSALEEAIRNTP